MGSVFYNSLLTVLWAGLVISTALDWDDYDALECPRPWQLFLVVDYGLVFVMCLMVRKPRVGLRALPAASRVLCLCGMVAGGARI